MTQPEFCEQCGAQVTPEMRFCEACGNPVAPTAQTTPPPPRAAAPTANASYLAAARSPKRGLSAPRIAAGAATIALVCLATSALGFWGMQNQSSATDATAGSGPPSVQAIRRVEPTLAAMDIPTQKPKPIVPSPSAPAAPVVQDAQSVLRAAQTQIAALQKARFRFERTDGATSSQGSGWLHYPDRATYTLASGTERVIVRKQMWSRPDNASPWTTEMSVGPLNNPIAWMQILNCVTSPRVMPTSTTSGDNLPTLSFFLASNAATCATAGEIQVLSGEGTVVLGPQSNGITRLYYNVRYTGQQLRGGVNAPMQITVEFSDWNSGSVPAIQPPQ